MGNGYEKRLYTRDASRNPNHARLSERIVRIRHPCDTKESVDFGSGGDLGDESHLSGTVRRRQRDRGVRLAFGDDPLPDRYQPALFADEFVAVAKARQKLYHAASADRRIRDHGRDLCGRFDPAGTAQARVYVRLDLHALYRLVDGDAARRDGRQSAALIGDGGDVDDALRDVHRDHYPARKKEPKDPVCDPAVGVLQCTAEISASDDRRRLCDHYRGAGKLHDHGCIVSCRG